MYRRVFLSVCQGRNALIHAPDTLLLSPKCNDKWRLAPGLRAAVQASCRTLGTSGANYCDKRETTTPTSTEEVKKEIEKTDELTLGAKNDEPVALKMEGRSKREEELKILELKEEMEKPVEREAVVTSEAAQVGLGEGQMITEANKNKADVQSEGEKVAELKIETMEGGITAIETDVKTETGSDFVLRMEAQREDGVVTESNQETEIKAEIQSEEKKVPELKIEAMEGEIVAEVKTNVKTEVESESVLKMEAQTEEGVVAEETEIKAEIQSEEKKVPELKIEAMEGEIVAEVKTNVKTEVESESVLKMEAQTEEGVVAEETEIKAEIQSEAKKVPELKIEAMEGEIVAEVKTNVKMEVESESVLKIEAQTEEGVVAEETEIKAEIQSEGQKVPELKMEAMDGEIVAEVKTNVKMEVESESVLKMEAQGEGGVVTESNQETEIKAEIQSEAKKVSELKIEAMEGEIVAEVKTNVKTEVESESVLKMEAQTEEGVVAEETEIKAEIQSEGQKVPELKIEAMDGEIVAEIKTEVKTETESESVIRMETPEAEGIKEEPKLEAKTEAEKPEEIKMEASQEELKTEPNEERKMEPMKKGEQVKSGKESLLSLLGAMKVEVPTKRKQKSSIRPSPKLAPGQMESTISMFQQAIAPSDPELKPELVVAAEAAASTMPNKKQAVSRLLQQLRSHKAVTQDQRRAKGQDIGAIIANMKVGQTQSSRPDAFPADQIHFDEDEQGYINSHGNTSGLDGKLRKGVFAEKRLNIFTVGPDQQGAESALVAGPTLWDLDLANQIVESTNQHPRNGFEEMIQWTKEGKLWSYPINNEAGMEEEANVPFHEHVFLERHLEDGFPRQGPVRHFMELVVGGLSKNPHLSVPQKEEHIAWFRDYFQQKEDVVNEAGAKLN